MQRKKKSDDGDATRGCVRNGSLSTRDRRGGRSLQCESRDLDGAAVRLEHPEL